MAQLFSIIHNNLDSQQTNNICVFKEKHEMEMKPHKHLNEFIAFCWCVSVCI